MGSKDRRITTRKGWAKWPRDVGTGFSYREPGGIHRADMQPARHPVEGLTWWRGDVWMGDHREEAFEVWAPTLWTCADAVELVCKRLTERREVRGNDLVALPDSGVHMRSKSAGTVIIARREKAARGGAR